MAPIFKYALSALCVLAACPVLAAPIQDTQALARRQAAGVGQGSDDLFTDLDNGTGYGIEDAEDNTANTINQIKGAVPARRQLNKIADGANTLVSAAGSPQVGGQVDEIGNTVDTYGTNDSADAGDQAGTVAEQTLEAAGSDAP